MARVERPSIDELRKILHYDPITGDFTWLIGNGRRAVAGKPAGNDTDIGTNTYRQMKILGRRYYAHILAFAFQAGKWPSMKIGHIDGNGLNNAWSNLRHASVAWCQHNRKDPQRGSTTGLVGVSRTKNGQFTAKIKAGMKRIYLGTFKTPEEAHAAYLAAKAIHHPGVLEPIPL